MRNQVMGAESDNLASAEKELDGRTIVIFVLVGLAIQVMFAYIRLSHNFLSSIVYRREILLQEDRLPPPQMC